MAAMVVCQTGTLAKSAVFCPGMFGFCRRRMQRGEARQCDCWTEGFSLNREQGVEGGPRAELVWSGTTWVSEIAAEIMIIFRTLSARGGMECRALFSSDDRGRALCQFNLEDVLSCGLEMVSSDVAPGSESQVGWFSVERHRSASDWPKVPANGERRSQCPGCCG
jgi:hypothetical protein